VPMFVCTGLLFFLLKRNITFKGVVIAFKFVLDRIICMFS
jgi:hypothetical protein